MVLLVPQQPAGILRSPADAPQPRRVRAGWRRLRTGRRPLDRSGHPGHTPGGICWRLEPDRALFTGDTLFRGAAGRTDLPGGDPRALTRSLRKLATLDGDWTVYPGHGEATTLARERRDNYFMQG